MNHSLYKYNIRIKLIGKSYCMEIIHIFTRFGHDRDIYKLQKGTHWKINIDDILR